jgi:hypothetical protein
MPQNGGTRMEAEELSWERYEVPTAQATWVCTKSRSQAVGSTADGIDYFLEFAAQNKRSADIPNTRKLQLRTSEYLVATDLSFLKLVVDGQMLETTPWDRFIEVYKRD